MACWKARVASEEEQRSRTKTAPAPGWQSSSWASRVQSCRRCWHADPSDARSGRPRPRGVGVDDGRYVPLALPRSPPRVARRAGGGRVRPGVRHAAAGRAEAVAVRGARGRRRRRAPLLHASGQRPCHLRHRSGPARSYAPAPRTPPHRVPGAAGHVCLHAGAAKGARRSARGVRRADLRRREGSRTSFFRGRERPVRATLSTVPQEVPMAFFSAMTLVLLAGWLVVTTPEPIAAAETPRRGGVLLAVIAAEPPSLDPHQESTFACIQLVAPLYSTLVQIDPYSYPKIVGDVASDWRIAPDGLTYTFRIRPGIRFHDGSPLTAADVKATYDKIVFPPEGVRSIRKNAYTAIGSIEAPDSSTVVFKLKFPSASLLANLASPWNVIYPKKYLDKDPNYFKTNIVGSGPFKFKNYTRGSSFEGERNPDYFVKDRPYLDGYKFFISPETSVRAAALRSGRAFIEFRTMPGAEVDAIRKQLGSKIVVQETPGTGLFGIAINNTVKPFTDVRVRKALTLAFDRYTASRVLYPLASLRDVGGLMRPATEWAMSEGELQKLPGFGKDMEKNRAEAKRLLAEAGYPNGFKVVLKNRNIKIPYQDFAVFVIQEWRKIGVEAEHRPLETAAWFADGRDTASFELIINGTFNYMDDPDLFLERYTTGDPNNWGRFSDPRIDDLFARQTRALDPSERKRLVNELEKIVLENAYHIPGLWWARSMVHWAKVKNYVAPPNHYSNQKLQDVWLAED